MNKKYKNLKGCNDRYTYELVETFGFTCEAARLIRDLYDKVDDLFKSDINMYKAWKCARLLSVFLYDGVPYDSVASTVVSLADAQEYFTNVLGYARSEYFFMKDAIINQRAESSTPDFAHMQYALSARLAFALQKDNFWGDTADLNTSENISYLAGWLGDATLTKNGTTLMRDDVYCADLDAENIYRMIVQGNTSVGAMNLYYNNLTCCYTRAQCFLKYISLAAVQEKVFSDLIDKKLIIMMDSAPRLKNTYMVDYYIQLIKNEQYHWDAIRENYYDTYNFLLSLRDGKEHITEY